MLNKSLWLNKPDHIKPVVSCSTLRMKCSTSLLQNQQRLQGEMLYRSITHTTYLQSSEQPVTLTTQFYHSSPLLPSLTVGIRCALNAYCLLLLHISNERKKICYDAINLQFGVHCQMFLTILFVMMYERDF